MILRLRVKDEWGMSGAVFSDRVLHGVTGVEGGFGAENSKCVNWGEKLYNFLPCDFVG